MSNLPKLPCLLRKAKIFAHYRLCPNSHVVSRNGATGARLSIAFDDETTGVQELKNSKIDGLQTGVCYNLKGQRVSQPTKGLYIVNGKKVIMK